MKKIIEHYTGLGYDTVIGLYLIGVALDTFKKTIKLMDEKVLLIKERNNNYGKSK